MAPVRSGSTTLAFRSGGAAPGAVELVVFRDRAAPDLAGTTRTTVRGGEATVVGPARIVLLTVTGFEPLTRRRLTGRLAGMLERRLVPGGRFSE